MLQDISENFSAVFSRMLDLINIEDSASLGDRNKYIGASDVGACGEKVVLNKLTSPKHSVQSMIRFFRGHMAETLVARVLDKAGVFYSSQIEVVHPDFPYILAHIDFVVHDQPTLEQSTVMIIKEKKSPKEVPDEPYDNQVMQIYYQMGLLKLLYPHADISGSIFNVSLLDGDFIDFGPYVPNDTVFASLVERAKMLKACVLTGELPKAEPSLLCGCCERRLRCTAHQSDSPPIPDDLVEKIKLYDILRSEKSTIEAQMDAIKKEVVFYTGEQYKNPVGDLVLRISKTADSYTLDSKTLKAEQPAVWEKYKKPKAGYVKMEVL